jgi:hypothetical protein
MKNGICGYLWHFCLAENVIEMPGKCVFYRETLGFNVAFHKGQEEFSIKNGGFTNNESHLSTNPCIKIIIMYLYLRLFQ